jgi:hypothetical protein
MRETMTESAENSQEKAPGDDDIEASPAKAHLG